MCTKFSLIISSLKTEISYVSDAKSVVKKTKTTEKLQKEIQIQSEERKKL